MNHLNTLNDAFAELERRADEHPVPVPTPTTHRGLLVGATVAAVAALAAGTAVLATRGGDRAAGQAGGTTHRHSSSSHQSDVLKRKLAREHREALQLHKAQIARQRAAERALKQRLRQQQHTGTAGGWQVPQDTADLQKEFARVLGNAATFTVTLRNVQGSGNDRDVFIGGIMTAADGSKGGYDVQIVQTTPGENAMCDDPDTMTCDKSTLPDGSTLAVGHEQLSSGAMLREADLITPDGVELVLHVSNQADPKGAGEIYGPNPPLTLDQVTAVATSSNW